MINTTDWIEFNKLNVSEVFIRTSPRYFVPHCRLNSIDCRHNWKLRRRIMGTCLELDPALVLKNDANGDNSFDVPKHLR